VTPVYAAFPGSATANAEPGIPMCYYVDRGDHLLQNWFHYPASLSLSLPGFHDDNAEVLRRYTRLAACAVSVPTQNNGELPRLGRLNFVLSSAEFEYCLAGMRDVANIYFAEGAERVYLPTKERTLIERPGDIDGVINRVRQNGPNFVRLATSHPQGGNAMRRDSLAVVDADGRISDVDNLTVADASLFPAGCGVNPQWTVNALARIVAENLVQRVS
jgi:choline dehydrogenase-like flavoprotein